MSVDDTVIAELTMRRVLGAHGRLGTSTRTMNLDGSLNQTFVGSESAPQRIDVDTNFPERNSPFLIVHVNQAADQNNTYHEAYNISLPVDVPDIEKLTLSIPPGPPFNRVLARFPVLSHWSTNGERLCEAFSPGQRCNGFRDAYLEFLRDVEEDEDRVWFYAMLVFPTDVDNTIFSGNSPTLRTRVSVIFHTPADIGHQLSGSVAHWRIGIVRRRVAEIVEARNNNETLHQEVLAAFNRNRGIAVARRAIQGDAHGGVRPMNLDADR